MEFRFQVTQRAIELKPSALHRTRRMEGRKEGRKEGREGGKEGGGEGDAAAGCCCGGALVLLKGKVKYAIQPPITLRSHAWQPTGISGVGTEMTGPILNLPTPPCISLSLSLSGHRLGPFLHCRISLRNTPPGERALSRLHRRFHAGNNSVLFPRTQRV